MAIYGVLGGTGFTGRLVLSALADAGLVARLGARRPERLAPPPGLEVESTRTVDVRDDASLAGFLDGVDVLLTTVGPFDELGRGVVAAAVDAGVPYVDSTGEQPFLRWISRTWDEEARRVGVPLVPAAGFDFVPGDLLTARAATHHDAPREVHVAYALPRTSDLLLGWSRGTRRTMTSVLAEPMQAVVGGRLVDERAGEARRLAWFPRPAGPRHAAAIPGGEPYSVPRHVPEVDTVRTYLAVPSVAAELLQAAGALARRPAVQRRLAAWLERPGDPGERRRASTRWACVAEVAGEPTAAGGLPPVSRAWAYGTDLYGFTAAAMVAIAERLVEGGLPGGVLSPAQTGDPGALLDVLASRTGLRWSVTAPSA